MSRTFSHSSSSRSHHHLRSITSRSPPSSYQTVSDASDNSTRTSQHTATINASRNRSLRRAAQQSSSLQDHEIGSFAEFLEMQSISHICNMLPDINIVLQCLEVLANLKVDLLSLQSLLSIRWDS